MHEKVFHFGEETLMLHKKKFHVKKQVSAAQESFIQKKQVSAAQKKVSCQKSRFLLHTKKFHVKKTGSSSTKKSFMSKKAIIFFRNGAPYLML